MSTKREERRKEIQGAIQDAVDHGYDDISGETFLSIIMNKVDKWLIEEIQAEREKSAKIVEDALRDLTWRFRAP